MKLEDVDLLEMLPEFMKKDEFDVLFAEAFSNICRDLSIDSKRVVIIGQVDSLNDAELDQLAEDMNIFWYSNTLPIENKRALIKGAPLVFKKLGTVWAIEQVINQYMQNSVLEEWFDYNGDPHYFRFKTNDTSILKADIDVFLNILEKIKRKSQWLEAIILELRAKGTAYVGCGFVMRDVETIVFEYIED